VNSFIDFSGTVTVLGILTQAACKVMMTTRVKQVLTWI